MTIKETVKQINDRWKNRRKMAWITFMFDHALILYLLAFDPIVSQYESIINTFLIISASIIGAYIGFSTYDDIKNKNNAQAFDTPQPEELDER